MKFDQNGYDTVIFTVEDFAEDLKKVPDKIFLYLTPNNSLLANNIVSWITRYPSLMGKDI
jgi:hypothetical protein